MTPQKLLIDHLNLSSRLRRSWVFILLTFVCFGLLPGAKASDVESALPNGNTADGDGALLSLTTGFYNSAFGFLAVLSNSTGNFNTGIGAGALLLNNGDPTAGEGTGNTAVGAGAAMNNTIGGENSAAGVFALFTNTDGNGHCAFGANALFSQDGGLGNTAVGAHALESNASSGNAAVGYHALDSFTGGLSTAIGADSMVNATTGIGNIAVGFAAGNGITTGSGIIAIGANGNSTTNGQVDNSCYIGGVIGAGVDAGTAALLFVDQDGKLGTTALPNTGNLPNTQALIGKMQELQALVARQQSQIEALTAGLQRVSAQLEVGKPAPQVVANKP